MALLSSSDETRDALVGDLRRIRRLVPPEVPLPATRATIDGETAILVDAADAVGWPGWRCAGAEHLAGPTDVVRRDDGHDIVLADLAQTCAQACGLREETGAGWHRGEVVTLVVSVLRGVVEAARRELTDAIPGSWWMTRDRRPVFVFAGSDGAGSAIGDASRELVRRIAATCDDRVVVRVCEDVLVALERPGTLERGVEQFEQALFDAAAPQPLGDEPSGIRDGVVREPRLIRTEEPGAGGVVDRVRAWLENLLDARVSAAIAEALGSLFRGRREPNRPLTGPPGPRTPERGRGRGRVAFVAGAAALFVIGLGVLWPSDGAGRAHERPGSDERAALTPAPTRDGGVADGAGEAAERDDTPHDADTGEDADGALDGEDPVRAARALLDEIDDVAGAEIGPNAAIDLVDDYGAVALLAVSASEGARQLLVIERIDGTWRMRDIYRERTG